MKYMVSYALTGEASTLWLRAFDFGYMCKWWGAE